MGDAEATAHLLQGYLTEIHTQGGVMEIDGVYAYMDIAKVYMVVVQALNTGLVVLIILDGTIQPVNTSNGVSLRT